MLHRVFAIALTDLRQTIKDRPVVFWMIVMPVVFIYAFGAMSSGGGRGVTINLLVVDEDQTFLSEAFTQSLGQEGFVVRRMLSIEPDTIATFPRSLHIPAGFQDSVATGAGITLRLHKSPDSSDEASLAAEMHLQRAIIRMIAHLAEAQSHRNETRAIPGPGGAMGAAQGPPAGMRVAPAETSPAAAIESLLRSLFRSQESEGPALLFDEAFATAYASVAAESSRVAVKSETAGRGRPVPSGTRQSFPATLTLFMMVNTAIYGAVFLTQEKADRILPRIATYAVSRSGILVGKLLGRTLLALGQAVILLLAGRFLLGVYLGNSPLGLALVILCLALTVASLALFWGAVLRSADQATVIALVASLFMGAVGGCWWPLEVVPSWMRTAGHISPAAWAMDGFHALISFGAGIEAVVVPCLVLLLFSTVFTLLGARFLRYGA